MYFHGACDEEEAEDRLRTRGDGGLSLTMTFIERKFYLVREGVTDRFVSLSVLFEGKYVHHTLMYGANHKWKEHGKGKSPPLAMKLEKSINQLLGALPIPSEQLVAMRCPIEERAKRSGLCAAVVVRQKGEGKDPGWDPAGQHGVLHAAGLVKDQQVCALRQRLRKDDGVLGQLGNRWTIGGPSSMASTAPWRRSSTYNDVDIIFGPLVAHWSTSHPYLTTRRVLQSTARPRGLGAGRVRVGAWGLMLFPHA